MTALRAIGVDLTELRLAFEADTQDLPWFFDTQTGAVLLTTAEYDPAQHGGLTVAQIEGDAQRFLRVPPSNPDQLIADMREFAEGSGDTQLKESLELALSAPRPDKRFKTVMSWLPEQQARWNAWRQQRTLERVTAWLAGHGLKAAARAA